MPVALSSSSSVDATREESWPKRSIIVSWLVLRCCLFPSSLCAFLCGNVSVCVLGRGVNVNNGPDADTV